MKKLKQMRTIAVRDKDTRIRDILGLIKTTRSVEEIQNICDELWYKVEDYNTDDLKKALPKDCEWEDFDFLEVWFWLK